ncbi:MAG: glycosyltransferase [Verrucomicrobia bacterium]|nr:glycosyltransferase [Verrucomicrobiota bacterium]
MKILLIQDYLRSGGTERQSVLLANAFAAAGHATILCTFRPGGALAGTVDPRVAHRALQPFDLGLDWFAPRLFRLSAAARPDVILCLGRMANCYAGSLQRRHPGAAVVATMRTGKTLPALFRRSLGRCRHIVANSYEAREALISDHGIRAEKIAVIYNSLVFPPDALVEGTRSSPRESLRAHYGAGAATCVMLCVAMFRPEKNQRELVEIVAGLSPDLDWHLWLAGDGPARASCERLAANLNLTARVRFLGFHHDPSPLYAAADLAVHASWSEALSNFLIEAQAHGLPVVAGEAQGIRECFIPGRTGWAIPRGDHAAFRAALTARIAEPPGIRAACAAAARTYARETFDPARQVAAYLDLFARLVQAVSIQTD